MTQFVIVGNGIAGLTAARTLRKIDSESAIILIGKETLYPFSRPGLMYINAQRLLPEDLELYERSFYTENNINLIKDEVIALDKKKKSITLNNSSQEIVYDRLLLATGSIPRLFSWKNDHLGGIYTYNSMPDALKMQKVAQKDKKAVVVGGGLTGLEVVECLHLQGVKVTYLVREKWYFDRALNDAEALLIHKRLNQLGVELRLEEEITEFVGQEQVEAVLTSKGNTIPCDFVYLTIGVVSNIRLAEIAGLPTGRGIIVDSFQRTADPAIFSAGDSAEIPDGNSGSKVELLWYTSRDQGKIAAYNMLDIPKTYQNEIFYNYARFLDMDYATIGRTNNLASHEKNYLFQNLEKNISIRIVYNDERVLGFNMLGLRWKKDVLTQFIETRKSLEYVLENLQLASYNPEFSRNYLGELTHA